MESENREMRQLVAIQFNDSQTLAMEAALRAIAEEKQTPTSSSGEVESKGPLRAGECIDLLSSDEECAGNSDCEFVNISEIENITTFEPFNVKVEVKPKLESLVETSEYTAPSSCLVDNTEAQFILPPNEFTQEHAINPMVQIAYPTALITSIEQLPPLSETSKSFNAYTDVNDSINNEAVIGQRDTMLQYLGDHQNSNASSGELYIPNSEDEEDDGLVIDEPENSEINEGKAIIARRIIKLMNMF